MPAVLTKKPDGDAQAEPLLSVRNLTVSYPTGDRQVVAVDDVSLDIARGEAVGIVGESGCGKSTVLRAMSSLLPTSGCDVTGEVWFDGVDLRRCDERRLATIRGAQIGLVMQDPVSAFNPAMTIGTQLGRLVRLRRPGVSRAEVRDIVESMLTRVGVPGRSRLRNYPFEFSQGQLQRIMIAAVCLAGQPALVLADEPTSSLDVTVEAQVIELLRELRQSLGLTIVFVSHDIGVTSSLCDRVVVMYAGRIVEQSPSDQLLDGALHPYSRQLLASVPEFPHPGGPLYAMSGDVVKLGELMPGCAFAPRCEQLAGPQCRSERPLLVTIDAHRRAACHLHDEHRATGADVVTAGSAGQR